MTQSHMGKTYGRQVVIVQRVLPHYRVEFFTRLCNTLAERGVRLKVLYGREAEGTVPRTVYPDEEWAVYIENRYMSFFGHGVVWQKCLSSINKPDIVIVEQANRLLVNYILLMLRAVGWLRVAYWGHGRNLQAPRSAFYRNFIKARLIKSVDWWFAYTELSADIIRKSGYPQERITVVENSIDTEAFQQAIDSVTREQVQDLRSQLDLNPGHIGLYCGGMYPDKKLPFLLLAAEKLRERHNDFQLVLIGSGPEEEMVKKMADKHAWIHYVGAVYGAERATYFSISEVMLMPGLVGLAIVDSFIASLPMITTDVPIHSPEIAYLENNINGVMSSHDIDSYVDAVSGCLSDENKMNILRAGCFSSASRYTMGRMVSNYAKGILSSLEI